MQTFKKLITYSLSTEIICFDSETSRGRAQNFLVMIDAVRSIIIDAVNQILRSSLV